MNINNILEKFLSNEFDVVGYFGDLETFFDVLKSRNLYQQLDIETLDSEDWQNEYLLWLYDNDRPRYYYWMQRMLSDIEIEDGKIYWVDDKKDLAGLFCDGRRYDISQETVERFLTGDADIWDPYWDTTDNVYRDVIEELDPKNIERLKEYIITSLKGKELSPETEEMELIATEQGHPEFWTISPENVARIIDDEESMNDLLGNELSELNSELFNIHSNAYNASHESEVYDSIFKELDEYFSGKGEYILKPHPYKKDVQVEKFKLLISDFEGKVNEYLEENKGYGRSGNLDNHSSFLEILKEIEDCLSVRISDYPNPSLVDKNINYLFSDYI